MPNNLESARRLRNILLICDILSGVLYVGTDILAGTLYAGYSFTEQAISELFAIGAPTSGLAVPLFTVYDLLLVAFALGVWASAGRNRALRAMALLAVGVRSTVWCYFHFSRCTCVAKRRRSQTPCT